MAETPTHDELVARAESLIPLLASNAERTEEDRRVADDNVKAIEEAGLYGLAVPAKFGGLEAPLSTWVDVSATLARGCGSTAWTVSLSVVTTWLLSRFSDEAQEEIFGNGPAVRASGVFTPTGTAIRADGGWVVTGRWPWASGIWHAHWAVVAFEVLDDTGSATGVSFGILPTTETTVDDTWFVTGMAGSGSATVVADKVFVPDHRVLPVEEVMAGGQAPEGTIYRAPVIAVGSITIAAPQLGIAAAALDHVITKAPDRGVAYSTYTSQVDSPTVQIGVGDAAAAIDAATLVVDGLAREVTEAAEDGRELSVTERTRIRAVTALAVRSSRDAIGTLASAHGTSSFAVNSPIQRWWRDAGVVSRHAFFLYETAVEVHGKALLGVENLPSTLI
ncbi:acyl-CoA dehydrogenase family protein [Rhodococcus globerulus]|uniref:Acyl-CoA dehydrogenase family protein n=1 Tax=Rhodococcus globerulus TaxID=33008 RepID=A0ABU4C3A3_RHOGO|nr:acyl-CoA dehydrogenase family protein [Rhodococcus globerulus]MDV6270985.1 acyl-CoA dehydrogenase family protein [Rhodococcus globerulus]